LAVRCEVVDFVGTPWAPLLITGSPTSLGFPVSERHGSVTGFYQYSPVGGDVLQIVAAMDTNHVAVGGGASRIRTLASSYTQFTVDITYFSQAVPDTCIIAISILEDTTGGTVHTGSFALIDDLEFGAVVEVKQIDIGQVSGQFALRQNYPNPFNPSTTLEFSLPRSGYVNLKVFNILGEVVTTLVEEELNVGTYATQWNAADAASGVYFYRLQAGDLVDTKKLLLLK
jgi:hypothetical protein